MNILQRATTRLGRLMNRIRSAFIGGIMVALRRTASGEVISNDNALKQAAVWACLSYLSRTVAQLPWRVMAATDKGRVEQSTHPVYRLLRVRPNPEMSPFKFKETMVWWAASWGNAVAEIQFDRRGAPVAMHPIHPSRVQFDRHHETDALIYRITDERGNVSELGPEDVLHLAGFGNGPIGLNVIEYAAESIGWARATEIFGAAYFRDGMAPSGSLIAKGKLSPEGLAAAKAEVKDVFGGARNAHKVFVGDSEMQYTPFAPDPEKMQLVRTRENQVEEICRWFGVPPHKVMHLLRSTFSNIEHQSIEVVVDSITPWCLRLEEEADWKLFGANRQGLYTKLDIKGLLRGDFKSRQEGLQIMRRAGVINADEWRELEDMPPIGTPSGNKYLVEGNMTTLDRIGEEPAASAAPEPADDLPPLERARQQLQRTLH